MELEESSERSVSCSQPLSSFAEGGEGLATRGHLLEGDPSLASTVASLLAEKLSRELSDDPGRKQRVIELLSKRRRRWKARHKGAERPVELVDERLREEKEQLEDDIMQCECLLVGRQDQGLAAATRLETQEYTHCMEVFRNRLSHECDAVHGYITQRKTSKQRSNTASNSSSAESSHLGLIQDLEATLSQAEAFAEIRKMKHTVTPRVPPLHNRTLSGNIFDQSLGVLHGSVLDSSTEMLDTEHAHLQIIGNEVSISSSAEEGEGKRSSMAGDEEEDGPKDDILTGSAETETDPVDSLREDTPGVAMEVVCSEAGGESSPIASLQSTIVPHDEVVQSILSPTYNALPSSSDVIGSVPNGFSVPYLEASSSSNHDPSGVGVVGEEGMTAENQLVKKALALMEENNETLSESDMEYKILRLFQDSKYDLRFPVRRYSNQASQASSRRLERGGRGRRGGGRERRSTPQSNRKRNADSLAASSPDEVKPPRKKRGRPRKNPPTPSYVKTNDDELSQSTSSSLETVSPLHRNTTSLNNSGSPGTTASPMVTSETTTPTLSALLHQTSSGRRRTLRKRTGNETRSNGVEWSSSDIDEDRKWAETVTGSGGVGVAVEDGGAGRTRTRGKGGDNGEWDVADENGSEKKEWTIQDTTSSCLPEEGVASSEMDPPPSGDSLSLGAKSVPLLGPPDSPQNSHDVPSLLPPTPLPPLPINEVNRTPDEVGTSSARTKGLSKEYPSHGGPT